MPESYVVVKKTSSLPRMPQEGSLDLTYRCNNNCRHCWLSLKPDAQEKKSELDFSEIRRIAKEAKVLGTRRWNISGGEPMLRRDFAGIFDYLTFNSQGYSLNTNGTLITPKIARLLRRKGAKMVALYGADAATHDYITRRQSSFEEALRGMRYLKEAGAGFIVQIIPMKDNYHQFQKMKELAGSLSRHTRVGAAWLHLSACRDKEKNKQILAQRLPAKEVTELDPPDLFFEDAIAHNLNSGACQNPGQGYFFSSCIKNRRDFHIDPYGKMSFCVFAKDERLRYGLKNGSFRFAWEDFLPSLGRKLPFTGRYLKNCGSCVMKKHCRACPVYAYLEHGDYSARINYLCQAAKENKKFKDNWLKNHRRYYSAGGLSIQVDSMLAFKKNTFHPKIEKFRLKNKRQDNIAVKHCFSLPDLEKKGLGKEVYRRAPWAIYEKSDSWIYLGISPRENNRRLHRVAVFNRAHTRATIYNPDGKTFLKGALQSLTLFPTDQILLARVLADRNGCLIHACGIDFKGKGLLFAGHSGAGKSTMAKKFLGKAKLLCDDRIIVRQEGERFKIYGTWSHGELPQVSCASLPLSAVFFLKKSKVNKLVKIKPAECAKLLLSCLIRPFVTKDWWQKSIVLVDEIARLSPAYMLYCDKSKASLKLIEEAIRKGA